MDHRFLRILLFCLFVFCSFLSEGQSKRTKGDKTNYKYFQIPGKVRAESGDAEGTIVNLINLETKQTEKSITVSSSGKFDFDLSYFKEYRISVVKDGYYQKDIDVSTLVPPNVWEKDSVFPPYFIVVSIFKKVEGIKLSFEGSVVGKIYYSPNGKLDNFDAIINIEDQAIETEIKDALKSIIDQKFNLKVSEALEFEKKSEYSPAYTAYTEALKIKPKDQFVIEKLKEIAEDIKNQSGEAKLKAEFNRLLALGDVQVSAIKYYEAIQSFKAALKLIVNEPIALQKLADAERLLAQYLDQQKNNAAFDKLIASGDIQVKATKYAEGIAIFKEALVIRPNDAATKARIANAELLFAQSLEQQKQNGEFGKLIASGDAQVKAIHYIEGILNFKNALAIRPNDPSTLVRIANAERLLALELDQQKNNAAFDKLIASGDAQVNGTKYAEGITDFKQALQIRPNDASTLVRIANAERLLAQGLDQQKQNAAFDKLIASGDAQVNRTKYAEGITDFKQALEIRPNDPSTLARIANAERLLALELDQQKQNTAFDKLIASGDAQVNRTKYVEGITDFKQALQIHPNDPSTLARIANAERLLALELDQQKQNTDFDKLIASGDVQVNATKYAEGITDFKKALQIRPNDNATLVRIADAEKKLAMLADEREKQMLYQLAIKEADQYHKVVSWSQAILAYQKASAILPNEPYPIKRISELTNLINQEKNTTRLYQEALQKGEDKFAAKSYLEAIQAYKEAQKIKPLEQLPPAKIVAIQAILDELASLDNPVKKPLVTVSKIEESDGIYLEKKRLADQNFKNSQWIIARFYYLEAYNIKSGERYIQDQIEACDKMIDSDITAEVSKEYKTALASADEQMKVKNYNSARFYYRKANGLIKWENYPVDQLKAIDKILTEMLSLDDQQALVENLKKADLAFLQKEYPSARFYYEKARAISETDQIVSRIKEIDSIVNGFEVQNNRTTYNGLIQKGDESFAQKNNAEARFYYEKASQLRPEEKYPKEKIKLIDAERVQK